MQDAGEVMRRLCLAYPWSHECQAIAPFRPTLAENQAIWSGEGGYEYAVGKNVPAGTQCESVQLVPFDSIMKRQYASSDVAPSARNIYMQFPEPAERNINFSPIFSYFLAIDRKHLINSFI